MRILVTGATGKVGQAFIRRFLDEPSFASATIRALCHHRNLEPHARLEVAKGSIDDRAFVQEAVKDVTHVLHLATSKETPESIMDVAVKGMFWLLEACRTSECFKQFLMVGGDAGIGHFFYPHPIPVTEQQSHSAYPGCYALSKVLEEVMLEQYYIQYQFLGGCLRAPWLMEKDDFKYQLSFEENVFGGPRWCELVGEEKAAVYARTRMIPVPLDAHGDGLRRNFVHVDDLVAAILKAIDHPKAKQQTFNVCMDEPVDYAVMGDYLAKTRGYDLIRIPTEFHSTWLDNSKAKFLLNWRPTYDLRRLIDASFDYNRSANDPRMIWYPG
jgi:nucleoside-diphosphate-sugar epimerase